MLEKINMKSNVCDHFDAQIASNSYILLDVLLCSIAEYFYDLCRILASP